MQLRPAADEPEDQRTRLGLGPAQQRPRRISFLHPGYPGETVLLSLPALDRLDGGSIGNIGGIDYDTALVACGLIAGNRWRDGFFSSDRSGSERVERPNDSILRAPRYFFQLPGPLDPPYPTVPRFSEWRFPHGGLPSLWQIWADISRTRTGAERAGGQQHCVLSNYGDGLEMAHLLPASEDD